MGVKGESKKSIREGIFKIFQKFFKNSNPEWLIYEPLRVDFLLKCILVTVKAENAKHKSKSVAEDYEDNAMSVNDLV